MSTLKNLTVTFTVVSCCYENCGRTFAMTATMNRHYKNTKNDFYCPYCKGQQGYYGKSKVDKLKDEVKMLKDEVKFSESRVIRERNKARAQKAAKTRLKNRIKNGACPCCNRTFKQLTMHMKKQHPEYVGLEK